MNKQELIVSGPSRGRQVAIKWIGLINGNCYSFPAPSEVDRQLYDFYVGLEVKTVQFPAPREVDRQLY